MDHLFVFDERLGIPLPRLDKDFEDYSEREQEAILLRWEEIRGMIPDRIKRLETMIIARQDQLNVEDNFVSSCRLNTEIAELASTINELHIWFRVHQDISVGKTHL
ncbi:hypothetical protein ACP26L_09720 [Paenibacillus sp. S-38]|uniref:hypothetical protein n=1 Tax=Paenibacillus sp. S-38 TaxID=3416710 RepID=UPI003CF86E3E